MMQPQIARRRQQRKLIDRFCHVGFTLAIAVALAVLCLLLYDVIVPGLKWLRWEFITSFASRFYDKAGILAPLVGSFWVMLLTAAIALPLGVATAVYLEFYAGHSWLNRVLQTNITNLAGVPSIVYGLLGLSVFVWHLGFGRSVLAAALTMGLLILPVIVVNTQEAIKAIPASLAHAAYAVGASKWQVIATVVLPASLGGILTGLILAISRALGEAAPMITVGAWAFLTSVPKHPLDSFSVLPIQIYVWAARPQAGFREIAATAIIVLLILLLTMNAVAVLLRNKYQKRAEW